MTTPRPTSTMPRDDQLVLNFDHYVPFLLNAVSSAWQRKTSAIYRSEYGLGITEWRVISMLNNEPNTTANRVCDMIRTDKAAVSRSLKTLESAGLAQAEAEGSDIRKRRWRLTEAGLTIHQKILAIALEQETIMLDGIRAKDIATTLGVLRHMLGNLDR